MFESEKNVYPSDVYSNFNGHFVASSFGDGSESTTSEAFLSTITGSLGTNIVLTESMSVIYNALYLWKSAVELASESAPTKWPDKEYVRLSLLDLTIATPSGEITIKKSNYLQLNFFILEIIDEVASKSYPANGITIKTDPILYSKCEFGKNYVMYSYSNALFYAACAVGGVAILCALLVLYFINKYQSEPALKFSSPIFLFATDFALILIAVVRKTE